MTKRNIDIDPTAKFEDFIAPDGNKNKTNADVDMFFEDLEPKKETNEKIETTVNKLLLPNGIDELLSNGEEKENIHKLNKEDMDVFFENSKPKDKKYHDRDLNGFFVDSSEHTKDNSNKNIRDILLKKTINFDILFDLLESNLFVDIKVEKEEVLKAKEDIINLLEKQNISFPSYNFDKKIIQALNKCQSSLENSSKNDIELKKNYIYLRAIEIILDK